MTRRRSLIVSFILAVLIALIVLPASALAAPSSLTVTQQPQNADVEYPGGATFHVEVSDPEQVASYQWIISDGYSDFVLTGSSATTDTLVIPSTQQDDPDLYARCVITDKDGNTVESEPGIMHVVNSEDAKTVLYVCDRAVQPGETLDLSETGLGTGTVSFDADGATITLDSVNISTAGVVYDRQISPALGLYLMRRNNEVLEYHVSVVGENVIENEFFDAEYNNAGIVFNTYFAAGDDPNPPTVIIEGDGTLALKGGSNGIYSDANIEIAATLSTEPNGSIYNDAITCRSLFIDPGAKLDLACNGTVFRVHGDARIDGATITARSVAPHVSVGSTAKSMIQADGSVYVKGSTISLEGYADPEQFVPYGSMLANYVGISYGGNLDMDGSEISISISEGANDEAFVMSAYGISGDGPSSAITMAGGSKIAIDIDMPDVMFVGGALVGGILEVDEGCSLTVTATSAGETAGVEADRAIVLTDGVIDSEVSSIAGSPCYGVVCGGLTATITSAESYLRSVVGSGVALAADTGEHGDFEVVPEDGYAATAITIAEPAVIATPEGATINLFGAPGYGETIKAETVYGEDMSAPATEVVIALAGEAPAPAPEPEPAPTPEPAPNGGVNTGLIVGGIIVVAVFIAALIIRGKKGDGQS